MNMGRLISFTDTDHFSCDKDLGVGNNLIDFLDTVVEKILISNPKSILFIPPDYTRVNSNTGFITTYLYHKLSSDIIKAVLPAVGLHQPMTTEQKRQMFGVDWKKMVFYEHSAMSTSKNSLVGEINIKELSSFFHQSPQISLWKKLWNTINVEVNQAIFDFDLVISLGQVVPHEILGYANYHKNILIGLGGVDFINKSHFISATLGINTLLAKAENLLRNFFASIYEKYIESQANIFFLFTVVGQGDNTKKVTRNQLLIDSNIDSYLPSYPENLKGLFYGKKKKTFFDACSLSEKYNIVHLPKKIDEVHVYMPAEKYHSLWLVNKAIYRTLGLIKKNGILYIDAPGLRSYGENPVMEELIAQYGYGSVTRIANILIKKTSEKKSENLLNNLAIAGHLIHGYQDNHQVIFIDYSTNPNLNTNKQVLNCNDYQRVGFGSINYQKYWDKLKSTFQFEKDTTLSSPMLPLKNKLVQHNDKQYYYIYDAGLGFWNGLG